MSRLTGKVAIVTGAASGIGKEIALRFAAERGVPVIADLNFDAADATAREIRAKGGDAFAVAMNVADEAAVEKGVADTMAKYGRIDVLVNNVGGAINFKPFIEFSDAEIRAEIDRSLMTTLYTCRSVLPSMACVLYEKLQPEGKSLEDYVRESEEGIQRTLY